MRSEICAGLILAVESALLWAALRHNPHERTLEHADSCEVCPLRRPSRLRLLVILNMLMITTFGAKMMVIFGLRSNVGNLWYATVFASQIVIFHRWGWQETRETIFVVYGALVGWLALTQLLALMPGPATPAHQAIQTLTRQSVSIVIASFLAFLASQVVLLTVYHRMEGVIFPVRYLTAVIAGQVADSALFFSVAFAPILGDAWQVTVDGLALKLAAGLCLAPAVYFAVRSHGEEGIQ